MDPTIIMDMTITMITITRTPARSSILTHTTSIRATQAPQMEPLFWVLLSPLFASISKFLPEGIPGWNF